jgi:hypothetical protein
MNWNAEHRKEYTRVSYGHLTGVSYPLTARALLDALVQGFQEGSIADDAEVVVNRPDGMAGEQVREEHVISRLEVVSQRVDKMPSLWEAS